METSRDEHPIAGHIFGRNPEAMVEAAIEVAITNYLKGGVEALQVGTQTVGMTNITQQTVNHIFTIEDLY